MIKQRQIIILAAVLVALFAAGAFKKINHARQERISEREAAVASTEVFNKDLATAFVTGLEVGWAALRPKRSQRSRTLPAAHGLYPATMVFQPSST